MASSGGLAEEAECLVAGQAGPRTASGLERTESRFSCQVFFEGIMQKVVGSDGNTTICCLVRKKLHGPKKL